MNEALQFLAVRPEPWTAGQIIANISVAFLLGLFVAWVYRATHRQASVSFSLVNTLVIVCMVMAMVMMVIGNNVARAFGLVGAMSIIRFRTVVKDTRDTAFVFFALGAGMAAGTGNLRIALIGTLLVGVFLGILHWTRHGAASGSAYLLSFDATPEEGTVRRVFAPVFEKRLRHQQLVGVKSVRMGELVTLTYQIELRDDVTVEALVRDLSSLEGIHRVTLSFGETSES